MWCVGVCGRAQLAERPMRAGQASLGASCDLLSLHGLSFHLLQPHPPTSFCVLLPGGGAPHQCSVFRTMALWLSILTLSDSNEFMLPPPLFLWPLSVFCGIALHPVLCPWPLPSLSMASPVLYPWPLPLHHGSFPHHTLLCFIFLSSVAFLCTAFQM